MPYGKGYKLIACRMVKKLNGIEQSDHADSNKVIERDAISPPVTVGNFYDKTYVAPYYELDKFIPLLDPFFPLFILNKPLQLTYPGEIVELFVSRQDFRRSGIADIKAIMGYFGFDKKDPTNCQQKLYSSSSVSASWSSIGMIDQLPS